ncbi:dihydropteroate synthase [Pandoraea thiooxydans]|nr:dihydropteroate synthase [Pandoraea thiooxydans]APR96159.1 dihydropteroate synthase [Pandoraea thiooxydans]
MSSAAPLPDSASYTCGRFNLDLSRPLVMGILNVTPDSFSDGGRFIARDSALRQAEQLLAEGADIIDIGGESSRPGSDALPLEQELERVIPIVESLRECGVPLSIDTYKPAVMRASLAAGADMINDIWGFRQPGAVDAVAGSQCGLCVMHMLNDPLTMQSAPSYRDVAAEVGQFLAMQASMLEAKGIARSRICVDPGFGFGKTLEHNLTLLGRLDELAHGSWPVLVGMSRKSMLGQLTGRKMPTERLAASVAAALCAAERGAFIIRVHDVAPTVDALKVWQAVRSATPRVEQA